MSIKITVFCNVISHSYSGRSISVDYAAFIIYPDMHQDSLKSQYACTRLHDITSPKTILFIFLGYCLMLGCGISGISSVESLNFITIDLFVFENRKIILDVLFWYFCNLQSSINTNSVFLTWEIHLNTLLLEENLCFPVQPQHKDPCIESQGPQCVLQKARVSSVPCLDPSTCGSVTLGTSLGVQLILQLNILYN